LASGKLHHLPLLHVSYLQLTSVLILGEKQYDEFCSSVNLLLMFCYILVPYLTPYARRRSYSMDQKQIFKT